MKRKRLILLASIILIVLAGFVFWNTGSNSHPVLVFKAYERSGTNAAQFAKLELRNTTRTPIWLYFSGAEFPLSTRFLERPMAVLPKATNGAETNVYSVSVGHFFMHGEKLLPGDNLVVEFPLISGQPPEQVGISYYVGNFKDGNDFIDNFWTPLLDNSASLKDRIEFYWEKSKRRLRSPEHHEVWCAQPLSFQAEKSYPTNIPAQSINPR